MVTSEASGANLPPPKTLKFRSLATRQDRNEASDVAAATKPTFSLCTYNVLIQEFVSPQRYPTVVDHERVFDRHRRRRMIQRDLQQMRPVTDIFCLEEVCPESYQDFLEALNDNKNHDSNDNKKVHFEGHLMRRQRNRPLHNAMFYNTSKFHLEGHYDINLHDKGLSHLSLPHDNSEWIKNFQALKFHTICNHFTFRPSPQHHLLVMMAHLHHNPLEDVIKYAEMSGLLQELNVIYQQICINHMAHQPLSTNKDHDSNGDNNRPVVYVVFAGDFNAQPTNQVYRLIMGEPPTLQSLQEETMVRPEWLQRRQQEWFPLYQQIYQQTYNNTSGSASVVSSLLEPNDGGNFASVYSAYNDDNHNSEDDRGGEKGHPRYTNLTHDFANTIDYIFYDTRRLLPLRLLELDTETYEKEDFLPSSLHASDHVILWTEFQCL